MTEPRMRVSDADREATAHQLQQAFSEGRLTSEELDQRIGLALSAKTYSDLLALVTDLPSGRPVDEVVHVEAKDGHIRRAGGWQVPRRLRVVSKYGSAELDLSEASIAHPVIEVEFDLKYGSATLVLPPGASADVAEVKGSAGSAVPTSSGPVHVRVSGELTYGELTVRYPRRHWLTH